jgi:Dolichyl-phosphate-mannose-protein mannosyltransferase
MVDLLILAVLLLVGLGAGRRALKAVPFVWPLEEGLFALTLSFGLLAYLTLAFGELGLLQPRVLWAALVLAAWYGRREGLAGLAIGARGLRRWLASRPSRVELAAMLLGGVLLGAEVVLVLAPAVGGDQTKYQLVYPRLYAQAHGLVDTPWSFWGYVQYLMNMLFAAAFVLRGDVLARLLNVVYGVLTVLAVFALGRRLFSRAIGTWAAILFWTLPLTATLMVRAWVEFALTAYVLLALLAVLSWREGGSRVWLAIGAVMAGFAGGTKIMGLLAAAVLGGLIFIESLRRDGARALRPALVGTIAFGMLAAIVASPCYLRNAAATGNPIYPFGYGVFGGRHWTAEAAEGLDAYYAAYRETQARKRGADAYGSWREALRFPWDLTMAPYSFEEVGRSTYDVGPFILAFAPGVLLLRRRPRVWLLVGVAVTYGAVIVFGMWAHPRYVHPALPLLVIAGVCVADALRGYGRAASRVVTAVLAFTVVGQTALAGRVLAPLWSDSAKVMLGRMTGDAFLRRHDKRYRLWSLVNDEVPRDGNVLVLGMIPHPYHLERHFTLASPLEQAAIDYRRIATLDDFVAALGRYGVTHVVREVERDKQGANPVGAHVLELWDELLARCEKIGEAETGALYQLGPTIAEAQKQGTV